MPRNRFIANVSRWPVRAQLVYLLVLVLVPVFAIVSWNLANDRRHARQQANAEVQATSERVSEALSRILAANEGLLRRLAARPLVQALDPNQCDPMLREFVALHPEFPNLVLADAQGRVVCVVAPERLSQPGLQSLPWWQRVIGSEGFLASNAYLGLASTRWVVALSVPVRDPAGRIAGALLFPADLLQLNADLLQVTPDHVLVVVTDGMQRILLRSREAEAFIGQAVPRGAPGTAALAATGALGDDAGPARLSASVKVPGTAWTVETSMLEEVAFTQANTKLGRAVVAGLVLLLVASLLAWRISLRIVRPIEALARVAVRVAQGEHGARAPEGAGPAEVEAVSRQVNQMLAVQSSHERVLANREQMFRSLFNNTPVPHILQQVQSVIVDVNAAFVDLSGYSREELLGRMVSEIGLWAQRADQDRATAILSRDGRLDGFEGIGRLRSGEQRFIMLFACTLEIDGVPHYLHSMVDITERRRAEEALREREERLSFLLSGTSALIYTSRASGDLGTTFVSDSVSALLGYGPSEFMDDPLFWSALLHPADASGFFNRKPALFTQGRLVCEYRLRHRDGNYRWIHDEIRLYRDADGQPLELIGYWADVTERKEAERRVRENEARFRTLTALSSDWYWEQDAQFRFVRLEGNQDERVGRSLEAPPGKTHWDTPAQNLSAQDWEQHRAQLNAHQQFRDFEISRVDEEQRVRWIAISGTPIVDERGEFGGYRGVGRDITAQKQAAEKIHQLAYFDALTGLPNRRRLMEQLRRSLMVKARSHRHGAVLFIDLDNFKSLNDTQGHDIGDSLLKQVALRLIASVRELDTVARLGGDEFVVVLDELGGELVSAAAQAEIVGQKILVALNHPYDLAGREHRSTPSIGITLFGASAHNVDDLLKQADLAMYQAKSAGRNTLRFFDVGMQASVDRRVAMEADLRIALARQELMLHFQPVVRSDGSVTGAEALARWWPPLRSPIAPGEFIPLAEASGLILPLGQWVLETA